MRIAAHLRDALIENLGCREEILGHYAYTFGDIPKYDSWKSVMNPYESVTLQDDQWVIGMGVTIEITENTWPKTTLVFPITVGFRGDAADLSVPFVDGVSVLGADYAADIDAFAAVISGGIENIVATWAAGASGAPRIGFAIIQQS